MTSLPADLEPLLQLISPESPSGQSLRYEPLYDQIREARREDDDSLPQGIWQTQLKRADWDQVSDLCQRALTRETKDLQLSAWLTEAWLSQHGLEGLERGLSLTAALVERFWDTLWPALEDGDTEARLSPLSWMDDKLRGPLGKVPLVWPLGPDSLLLGDWQQLVRREKQAPPPGEGADTEAAPAATKAPLTREGFLAATARIPASALTALTEQLARVFAAASALEQALDTRLGRTSAALRRTRVVLEEFQSLLTLVGSQRPATPAPLDTAPGLRAAAAAPGALVAPPGALQSRAEAYQLLAIAADFLLNTEPHSPVPYLVKRAMAWGEMPLGQLLGELVPDTSGLASIQTLLGMKPAAEG